MLYIICVHDSAAGHFNPPFMVPNKGIALREFSDACNNKESFLGKHPADFSLFCLGTFDEVTAVFDIFQVPQRMALAIEYVNQGSVNTVS